MMSRIEWNKKGGKKAKMKMKNFAYFEWKSSFQRNSEHNVRIREEEKMKKKKKKKSTEVCKYRYCMIKLNSNIGTNTHNICMKYIK